jgi:hypothetical protein
MKLLHSVCTKLIYPKLCLTECTVSDVVDYNLTGSTDSGNAAICAARIFEILLRQLFADKIIYTYIN